MEKFRIDFEKGKGIVPVIVQFGQAACHDGYRSCFFRRIEEDDTVIESSRVFNPSEIYKV